MSKINKPYGEQEFAKEGFEKGADAIVNTIPHTKRSNIDEVGVGFEPGEREISVQVLADLIKGSESVNVDVEEGGEHLVVGIDEQVLDFILPKEISLTKIDHEVGTTNTIITTDAGVFDADNGYHVYFEVEGTGTHFGADFTVFPFNEDVCLTVFSFVYDNNTKTGFASLNEQGQLIIDIPIVMTPESQDTIIHYKRII